MRRKEPTNDINKRCCRCGVMVNGIPPIESFDISPNTCNSCLKRTFPGVSEVVLLNVDYIYSECGITLRGLNSIAKKTMYTDEAIAKAQMALVYKCDKNVKDHHGLKDSKGKPYPPGVLAVRPVIEFNSKAQKSIRNLDGNVKMDTVGFK